MPQLRVGRGLPLLVLLLLPVTHAAGVPLQDAQLKRAASPQQRVALPSFAENDTIPEPLRVQTFTLVWETIRDRYFDPALGGVDWEAVRERYAPSVAEAKTSGAFHSLLARMLKELPGSHLAILAPHQLQTRGATSGSPRFMPDGLVLRTTGGQIVVYAVVAGSPAEEVGLVPGETILKAGDVSAPSSDEVLHSPRRALATIRRALAGDSSRPVELTVLDALDRTRTLSVPRSVPFRSQPDLVNGRIEHRLVASQVGYLRFEAWSLDLPTKLDPVLRELRDTRGLIIDLRQNPGGTDPGVDCLASFLNAQGGVLSVVTPRSGEREDWSFTGSGAEAYRGRVAILVDEGSGSASEAFAAAMQESGRAVVLGATSAGAVLNSTQLPLPSGGILQYPHSDVRTPGGRRIEGHGVVPDIPVQLRRGDLLDGKDTVIERAIQFIVGERG